METIVEIPEKEYLELNKKFQLFSKNKKREKNTRLGLWLIACPVKTIKEHVGGGYHIEGLHAINEICYNRIFMVLNIL